MLDACYKKGPVRIDQSWFYEELNSKVKADIYLYHGIPMDLPMPKNAKSQNFHTIITDLSQEEEILWNGVHKNMKYEIRRNNKDGVTARSYTTHEVQENKNLTSMLADLYMMMYESKGIKTRFNFQAVEEYVKQGAVIITGVFLEETPIILHSYLVDDKQVRLLHSVSNFRDQSADSNMVGRSNKRLHWEDYLLFKSMGIKSFDWGGISDIENPNGIDAFKLKFGGATTTYQNVYVARTLLGKIGLWRK